MTSIINNGEIVDDFWYLLNTAAEIVPNTAPGKQKLLLPLAHWEKHRDALMQAGHHVGFWLAPNETPEALIPQLNRIQVIAIQFCLRMVAVILWRGCYRSVTAFAGSCVPSSIFCVTRYIFCTSAVSMLFTCALTRILKRPLQHCGIIPGHRLSATD